MKCGRTITPPPPNNREVNYDPELIAKANAASAQAVESRFGGRKSSIAGPKPPPRRAKKVVEAPPMVGKGGRYDKSGDVQVIRDLVSTP